MKKDKNIFSILALTFGILGVVTSCLMIGFIFDVLAIVFGIIAYLKNQSKAMIIIGMITGGIGILVASVMTIIIVNLPSSENTKIEIASELSSELASEVITEEKSELIDNSSEIETYSSEIKEETSEKIKVETNVEEKTEKESNLKESNINGFKFARDEFEVMEGKSTSLSSVKIDLKDEKSFSTDDVIFKSENENIATIRFENGALTTYLYFVIDGIAPGETKIYVVSKDGSIESEHIKVIVTDDGIVDPESIIINSDKIELKMGDNVVMSVEPSPKEATVNSIEWTSSDEKVLTVNEKGVVKAVGIGVATITAKISDSIQASYQLKVTPAEVVAKDSSEKKKNETVQTGSEKTEQTYVLNTSTKKFHKPSCSSVKDMKEKNKKTTTESREKIIEQGYEPCKRCNP